MALIAAQPRTARRLGLAISSANFVGVSVVAGFGFICYRASQATGFYWQDDYTHLMISREAWHHPGVILNVWGRPIMTLAYMPGSLGGDPGARTTSLVLFGGTAILCWLIARSRGSQLPAVAPLLLLAQPLSSTLAYSALPETVFSFALALALWLHQTNRAEAAALAASLLPAARLEGIVVIGIWAIWLAVERRWRTIPLLAVGVVIWTAAAALIFGDPLWLYHNNPYGILGSRYGAAGYRYVFVALAPAFGSFVAILALSWGALGRRLDRLVPSLVLGLLAFYALAWGLPAFQSIAAPVYLVSVSVPVALCASDVVDGCLSSERVLRKRFLVVPAIATLVALEASVLLALIVLLVALVVMPRLSRQALFLGSSVALTAILVYGLLNTSPLKLSGTPLLSLRASERLGSAAKHVSASTSTAFDWFVYRRTIPGSLDSIQELAVGQSMLWDSDVGRYEISPMRLVEIGFRPVLTEADGSSRVIVFRRIRSAALHPASSAQPR